MSDIWDFNAPRYVNFECLQLNDNADEWFETEHEIMPATMTRSKTGKLGQKPNEFINDENIPPKDVVIDTGNHIDAKSSVIKESNSTKKNPLTTQRRSPRLNSQNLKINEQSDGQPTHDGPKRIKLNKPLSTVTACPSEKADVQINPMKGGRQKLDLREKTDINPLSENSNLKLQKQHGIKKNALKEKFRSLAEQVNAFHRETPERFHSRNHKEPPFLPQTKFLPLVTIPKTPNLRSRFRTRPVNVMSREQKESQELEECKKHQFKANPLDKKILETREVVKIDKKPTTVQEPFNLTKMDKILKVQPPDTEKKEFHARPIPAHLFDRPLGLRPLNKLPLTSSKSPNFTWKQRVRTLSVTSEGGISKYKTPSTSSTRRRSKSFNSNSIKSFRTSRPEVLHSAGVLSKMKWENKKTKVVPFSFDEYDKIRFTEKQKKIENILNEEQKKHEFHSRPLPKLEEPTGIPEKKVKPATEIQPFNFHYERNQNHQSHISEGDDSVKRYEFRARPPKSILQEPFIPAKSTKPPTNILDIQLNTEKRALKRKDYDEFLKRREAEMKEIDLWREKESEIEEKEEIKELRKKLVHKAEGIKQYKPVIIRPSPMPITVPVSPQIKKKTT